MGRPPWARDHSNRRACRVRRHSRKRTSNSSPSCKMENDHLQIIGRRPKRRSLNFSRRSRRSHRKTISSNWIFGKKVHKKIAVFRLQPMMSPTLHHPNWLFGSATCRSECERGYCDRSQSHLNISSHCIEANVISTVLVSHSPDVRICSSRVLFTKELNLGSEAQKSILTVQKVFFFKGHIDQTRSEEG